MKQPYDWGSDPEVADFRYDALVTLVVVVSVLVALAAAVVFARLVGIETL